jgi:hypothetical protein
MQERMDSNAEAIQEDVKSGQAEMRAIIDAWMTDMPRCNGCQSREDGSKSRRKGGRSGVAGDS